MQNQGCGAKSQRRRDTREGLQRKHLANRSMKTFVFSFRSMKRHVLDWKTLHLYRCGVISPHWLESSGSSILAWASWSIQSFLAWKLLGILLSAHYFLTRSSPAVFYSCIVFSLSPSLFCHSLSPLLKSLGALWFSKGRERALLLSYRRQAAG